MSTGRGPWFQGEGLEAFGAYWAVLGPEVDLRRTAYDFEMAAEAVRRTEHPEREDLAGGIVRPPTAEEAITVFERMAGRTYPR